ncbi:MAG: ParB/RepB/Spo0J family partition protein [Eubacteriales bacterium]|nr:ParB/RepB/Spo0J family partition protein [Eubacteriales bacterium]
MKRNANISLKSFDDIFETDESREEKKLERVRMIDVTELHPFKDHPFKVTDDEAMLRTVESISKYGVLSPLIARPLDTGGYEIVSGHRRCHAAELAGIEKVPVIVREMDDDEATILMVDANLQREKILPSERAKAYKMKNDAMKRQAGRPSKDNRGQVDHNLFGKKTVEQIADESGDSAKQVQRYIRLNDLIPEISEMVDNKQIAFNPAVELSFLKKEEQEKFLEAMDYSQAAPSLSQAQRIKKLSQEGKCTQEAMCEVMEEQKKGDLEKVVFKADSLRKYFPKSYTPKQMEDMIYKLLDQWVKKKERGMER